MHGHVFCDDYDHSSFGDQFISSITQNANETYCIYAFLKRRGFWRYGQTWWRKPENPGKSTLDWRLLPYHMP